MSDFIKHDSNKPQPFKGVFQYFPKALMAVAIVSGYGAKKYEWGNWAKARGADRYWEALTRHFLALCGGERLDEESGLRHIEHLAWNALAVLELELRQEKENGSQRIQPQPGDGAFPNGGLSGSIARGNGACDEVAKRSGSDPVADQSFKSPCRFCTKGAAHPCEDLGDTQYCTNFTGLSPSDTVADPSGFRWCKFCAKNVRYPCKNSHTSQGCLNSSDPVAKQSNSKPQLIFTDEIDCGQKASDEVAEPSSQLQKCRFCAQQIKHPCTDVRTINDCLNFTDPKPSDIVANPSSLITTCKVCGGGSVFCKACMPLL